MMDPADRPVTSRRPWNEGKLIGARLRTRDSAAN